MGALCRGMTNAEVVARPDPEAAGRVIVVGVGLAGLTAAIDLREAGWDASYSKRALCRRPRAYPARRGRRCRPRRGVHAEVGGESIDEQHTEIQRLLRRFGIATERRPGSTSDRVAWAAPGTRGTHDLVRRPRRAPGGTVYADYLRVGDALDRLVDDYGIDAEHPEAADRATELDVLELCRVDRRARAPSRGALRGGTGQHVAVQRGAGRPVDAVHRGAGRGRGRHPRCRLRDDACRGRQRVAPEGDRGRARSGDDPRRAGDDGAPERRRRAW